MFRLVTFSLIYCLLSIVLQGAVLHGSFAGIVVPDLVLIYVVFLALRFNNLAALFIAFFLGLVVDFASARLIGPFAGAYVFSYLMVYLLVGRLFAKRYFVFALIVFTVSLAKSSMLIFMIYLAQVQEVFIASTFTLAFKEALFTAVLSPLVLMLFGRMFPEKFSVSKRVI